MIASIHVHTRRSKMGLPATILDLLLESSSPRHLVELFSSSATAKVMVSTRSQRKRAASPVEAVAIVKAEEDSTALSDIASPPKKVRKTKGKGSITAAKVKKEESEDEFVPLPVDEAATPAPKGKAKAPPTPKSVKEDNDGLGPKPAKTAGTHSVSSCSV